MDIPYPSSTGLTEVHQVLDTRATAGGATEVVGCTVSVTGILILVSPAGTTRAQVRSGAISIYGTGLGSPDSVVIREVGATSRPFAGGARTVGESPGTG